MKEQVYFEVLNFGQTSTADLFARARPRRPGTAPSEKQSELFLFLLRFLCNNARLHIADYSTKKKIEQMGWKVLPHPRYSPDVALSAILTGYTLDDLFLD